MSTAPSLRLALLGPVQVHLDDRPLRFPTRKALALLCYLACQPGPVERAHLATLFWGDSAETAARRNLRVELNRVARQLPQAIVATRHTLSFRRDQPYWLDVEALQAGAGQTATMGQRLDIADLYRGDFLDDLTVVGAPDFEQWQGRERDRQWRCYDGLMATLVTELEEAEQWAAALAQAQQRLERAPWLEEAYRPVMTLQARLGRRSQALRTFGLCRQTLMSELGVEPTDSLLRLAATIEAEMGAFGPDNVNAAAARPNINPNFPLPATTFIGRQQELTQLESTLTKAECRLLSLVGMGGVGKTRLGIQLAQRYGLIAQVRLVYVSLAEWPRETDALAKPLAAALNLEQATDMPLEEQLQRYLRSQELLLMLDNCEHLLPLMRWLGTLLAIAPGLKILTTSREPLQLASEWIFQVDSLPYPQAGASPAAFESFSLFVSRAERAAVGFSPAGHEVAIGRICELVHGLPLGIELAAGTVRMLTPAAIATTLQANIDALRSHQRDVPARQRSLQATFNYSYELLEPESARIYRQLAIFPGDFSKEAASAVAGADEKDLWNLVDKSLVERGAAGRFHLHPLLRHFARKLVSAEVYMAGIGRLAVHLTALVEQHGAWYCGPGETHFMKNFALESANIDAVLTIFLEQPHRWQVFSPDKMTVLLQNWIRFLLVRGLGDIGITFAEQLLSQSATADHATELPQRLKLIVQLGLAACYLSLSRITEAEAVLFDLPTVIADDHLDFERLFLRGSCQIRRGNYATARALLTDAYELAVRLDRPALLAESLRNLATVTVYEGALNKAKSLDEQTLAACRAAGFQRGEAIALTNLGTTLAHSGDHIGALTYYREALQACKSVGSRRLEGMTLSNLGSSSRQLGRLAAAQQYYQRSLTICQEFANGRWEVVGRTGLANTLLALGDLAGAREQLRVGLNLAMASDLVPDALENLHAFASLKAQIGAVQEAVMLLYFISEHEACPDYLRRSSQMQLEEFGSEIPDIILQDAQLTAQLVTLNALVSDLLKETDSPALA